LAAGCLNRKLRTSFLLLSFLVALYVGAATYILHFQISRVLFPHIASVNSVSAQDTQQIIGQSGNGMLLRRYGSPQIGCVVFFPGQHGGNASYEAKLIPSYVANGMTVFALAYPGQDGAQGRSDLGEVQSLALQALSVVSQTCPPSKTVFVGRSLGSMVAAYTAGVVHPAGLVLESAAPSLSSAILGHLRSHRYLFPLTYLPVSSLLEHDYSLAEALPTTPPFPVVVFQGMADDQTPIEALLTTGTLPQNSRLIAVPHGTHSNTYLLVLEPYVQAAIQMLRHEKI
jgi:hypothetical protein